MASGVGIELRTVAMSSEVLRRMESISLNVIQHLADGFARPSVFAHRRVASNMMELEGVLVLCGAFHRLDFVRHPRLFAQYFGLLSCVHGIVRTGMMRVVESFETSRG